MHSNITEWEFTAEAASRFKLSIVDDASLPFSDVRVEQRGSGSAKRRDITILDKSGRPVITGEVKLPFQKDGSTPYNENVVQDARSKAQRAGAKFFFTWNVNECVLWETFPKATSQIDRKYKSWIVTEVHKAEHLDIPGIWLQIDGWSSRFIHECARIIRGVAPFGTQSPDEKFIDALESSLRLPILFTLETLEKKYKDARFKAQLDRWMREEQGWIILDDPRGVRDNLERASRFASYALVNKLVFHEALRKGFKDKMDALDVSENCDTGEGLRIDLESYFHSAKFATGDYETVFGEDHIGIGNRIPFYSDNAVPHWRALVNQIHNFDFSKLDYEVIGSIFERLIAPEERHKYGQYYTRPEVVDLINSFCIRTGNEVVMDPACGGGTFLVRAYVRKRELALGGTHKTRLTELFGTDVSHFASHLTTINLASRDFVDAENYPQIARANFFDVSPSKPLMQLPRHDAGKVKAKGLGQAQQRIVEIPPLDAIVGNPPYIRQEDIPKNGKNGNGPKPGTKEFYRKLVKEEANADLSGRSDIHCYFWPHAWTFLKSDGYLCFLTSTQWLDVEYGFKLQEWILRNFRVIAIFESIGEPWFVGARVATTVTILQRENDETRRMDHTVRFIQLRRPIAELLAHDGTSAGMVETVDEFRDEILNLKENTLDRRYRAQLVRQGELWNQGVELGLLMNKSSERPSANPNEQRGAYYGGKWGVHLRAPDLWFELLQEFGDKLVPLGKIADVRFGVKSGKDEFFYPIDETDRIIEKHLDKFDFETVYGVPLKDVKSGKVRLVRCGEGRGEVRPIEAKYLEPEVHSLMEIGGFEATPAECTRRILLIGTPKSDIRDVHVRNYVEWGEKRNFHTGATCAARVTDERAWYDLTGHVRGQFFWPKAQQYRHVIAQNPHSLQCNCNLYDLTFPDDFDIDFVGGLLNCSLVILAKHQYGRPVGVEGNLKTEVVDVNMTLVPDPSCGAKKASVRVADAFRVMKQRRVLQLLSPARMKAMTLTLKGEEAALRKLSHDSELSMQDRRDLDDAVLEFLGIKTKKRRNEIRDRLYRYLGEYFESVRLKEEMAIENKARTNKRGQIRPEEVALELNQFIMDNDAWMIRKFDPDFFGRSRHRNVFELPSEGVPEKRQSLFHESGVIFKKGKRIVAEITTMIPEQDDLLILVVRAGQPGYVALPDSAEECNRLYAEFGKFFRRREDRIWELIRERTSDEELQEKIYAALIPHLQARRID